MYEHHPHIRLRAAGLTLAGAFTLFAGVARAGDTVPLAPQPPAQAVAAPLAAEAPILVLQPSSSAEDANAAVQVTQLVAQRLRFVYGDTVKLVQDTGGESIGLLARHMQARLYIGGSIERVNGTYYVDLQSREPSTNAVISEQRFGLPSLDALPKDAALVGLVEPGPLVPNAHYVLVPLIDDDAVASLEQADTYLKTTQDDLVKQLRAKGITTTLVAAMDPVDVRIGAADLCRDNNATGVVVGHTWYKQDYKEGSLKSGAKGFEKALEIVPIAGPIMAGMVNAGTNAVAGAGGSDDKYVAHSEVDLTLLSCEGKRLWSGGGAAQLQHFSDHNVAAGQVGAIDAAVGTAVDQLSARR